MTKTTTRLLWVGGAVAILGGTIGVVVLVTKKKSSSGGTTGGSAQQKITGNVVNLVPPPPPPQKTTQSITVNNGDKPTLQPAIAGSFLSIALPQGSNVQTINNQPLNSNVASSLQGTGASDYVPFSCPDPCQFILDGTAGQLAIGWTDSNGNPGSAVINIVGG